MWDRCQLHVFALHDYYYANSELYSLIALLFVGENMFSQIQSMYKGIYEPLFVATNVDRSDCVHISVDTLHR